MTNDSILTKSSHFSFGYFSRRTGYIRSRVTGFGRPFPGFLTIALTLLFCSPLFSQNIVQLPTARPNRTVVIGTDNPLVDVPAVQSAVNVGGLVILRGTFDFGAYAGNHIIVPGRTGTAQDQKGMSTVFIYQRDVVITGETGPGGELRTVVKNGMPAFWIGWDGEVSRVPYPGTLGTDFGVENLPVDAEGRVSYRDGTQDPGYAGSQVRYARAYQNVSVTVRAIFFDSPKHYGVKATAGRDIFVTGNTFKDVQFGGLVHFNNFANATHIAAAFAGVGSLYAPFVGPSITGSFVAERNIIENVGTETINTHAGESIGIGALVTVAAVRIERNEIRDVGRQPDGTFPETTATAIVLTENYGSAPIVGHNLINNSKDNGIWDLALFAPSPGPTIEQNMLVNCTTGIQITSLMGPRPGLLIQQNAISQDGLMGNGQYGILAYQLSDSMIRANTFRGDYNGPLVVFSSSTNSTLIENRDLRVTFPPWSPTYFMDASSSGNLTRAANGSYIDLGTNNIFQIPGRR